MSRSLSVLAPLAVGMLISRSAFAQDASPDPATRPPVTSAEPATSTPATPTGPAENSPTVPSSDRKEEARAHYNKALGLFDDGAFDAALIEFKKAYESSPSFRILYNMGVTSERLKDFVSAVHYYEQFLKDGGADVKDEQRANVKEQVQLLGGRIAKVTLKSNVADAEFFVDDVSIGKGPIVNREINAGQRKFSASAKDMQTEFRAMSVPGGDTFTVELSLKSIREVKTITQTAHIPWLGIAGTVVFTGAAIGTGILTLNAGSKYDGLVSSNAQKSALDDQRATVRSWSITTDVLVLGAIGFATYTVVDILMHQPNSDKEKPSVQPTAAFTRGGGTVGALFQLR